VAPWAIPPFPLNEKLANQPPLHRFIALDYSIKMVIKLLNQLARLAQIF
jgi:hypothetical protein